MCILLMCIIILPSGYFSHGPFDDKHDGFTYSYGPLPVISTYNPIYRMYSPI